jgi:hypothetical protein
MGLSLRWVDGEMKTKVDKQWTGEAVVLAAEDGGKQLRGRAGKLGCM